MQGTDILVILGAAVLFGVASGFAHAAMDKPHHLRMTISKPDDDRVLMTAEMTGWSEKKAESLAATLIEQDYQLSIHRLDKEQSGG